MPLKGMAMKRMVGLVLVLLLSAGSASASTTQKWTAGWDNFSEPLNFIKSKVTWSVNPTTRKLSVTFMLVGANPSKLYQMSIHFFCTTFPPTFGQFPTESNNGACVTITRQGVTASVAAVELGVVTTDIHGNGKFTVVIGPIAPGTYNLEFIARNGAGCGLAGGGPCDVGHAESDYQSPGPTFGDATTIVLP